MNEKKTVKYNTVLANDLNFNKSYFFFQVKLNVQIQA